ncbi:hypothetical protein [Microvirga massiliensis]|uniref:hypothetical protein n=1 Tax=Microvirga massiliensis TaxID=1033741 RepID=UPI000AAE3121|nr:hypothetical protein [Microvirga massiliensis]
MLDEVRRGHPLTASIISQTPSKPGGKESRAGAAVALAARRGGPDHPGPEPSGSRADPGPAPGGAFPSPWVDIPWAIHGLVPEGRRIKPRTAGVNIRSRGTRQTCNLEIGIEQMCADGLHIRVTDKARTVIDLVRWGGVRQHAVEAVRA